MGFGRIARIGAAVGLVTGLAYAAVPVRADTLPPGCDASRSVVAYHAGGAPTTTPDAHPCLVATGFGGAETQIVSLANNDLVYEPAILTPGVAGTGFVPGAPGPRPSTQFSPGGLAVSSNAGRSWSFDAPAGSDWVPQDDALYVDRSTDRLFFYALAANPIPTAGKVAPLDQIPAGEAHLMMSKDDGQSWNEVGLPGFVESENPRFTSAPPPTGSTHTASTQGGYPDVTYWCGNDSINLGEPLPGYRACYRSLDGGVSWQFASILASGPVPQHSQCGSNAETFSDTDPDYPEGGAPDGSLYAEVNCGGVTYLARSRDEAATWPLVTTGPADHPVKLPANGELRVDSAGTLYLTYLTGASTLNLQVSHDGGLNWSTPLDMTPPAARNATVVQWAVAERDGQVAASYLVQRGNGSDYDGYLSFTRDALDGNPLFYGSALNTSSTPMRTSAPPQARDDYIGVDITPAGSAWASFAASCPGPVTDPGSSTSKACAGQASDPEANEAVAGTLDIPGV